MDPMLIALIITWFGRNTVSDLAFHFRGQESPGDKRKAQRQRAVTSWAAHRGNRAPKPTGPARQYLRERWADAGITATERRRARAAARDPLRLERIERRERLHADAKRERWQRRDQRRAGKPQRQADRAARKVARQRARAVAPARREDAFRYPRSQSLGAGEPWAVDDPGAHGGPPEAVASGATGPVADVPPDPGMRCVAVSPDGTCGIPTAGGPYCTGCMAELDSAEYLFTDGWVPRLTDAERAQVNAKGCLWPVGEDGFCAFPAAAGFVVCPAHRQRMREDLGHEPPTTDVLSDYEEFAHVALANALAAPAPFFPTDAWHKAEDPPESADTAAWKQALIAATQARVRDEAEGLAEDPPASRCPDCGEWTAADAVDDGTARFTDEHGDWFVDIPTTDDRPQIAGGETKGTTRMAAIDIEPAEAGLESVIIFAEQYAHAVNALFTATDATAGALPAEIAPATNAALMSLQGGLEGLGEGLELLRTAVGNDIRIRDEYAATGNTASVKEHVVA